MDLLKVKAVSKTYGSGEAAVHALKKASFTVPKGEFVAIVGESGSGKTTLLNMIGALDTPTSGKVFIDGKDIFAMKEKRLTIFRRRNIGFIFQSFNLIPELTVEQNMIFPVLLDYQKPDKRYLEELLSVLNLKERPKSYKSLILNIIFAILTVILLAGAGYFIYTRVLPKTDTTLEEKPAEVLKHEAADLPPGQEAPVKYAPDDIKGPKGLQVARDALKRKVEPDTAMALAQQLFAAADDVKAQDGAFLIADELAKKGNAQALLMLGDFYSPKQPQRGTIQKDTDMANDCYKKALAAGAAEAQQRLDALK